MENNFAIVCQSTYGNNTRQQIAVQCTDVVVKFQQNKYSAYWKE